jgi:4-hydroxy-3-methylbut-2-en-1-yl diphosphate synthase IspG/GcpE
MEKFVQRRAKRRFVYCPSCGRRLIGIDKYLSNMNTECQCAKCGMNYVIMMFNPLAIGVFTDRRAVARA